MTKLTKTNIDELIVCDQVFHNWGRIMGAIGKLFVPPKPDDSHTNFYYDHPTKQLEGRPFSTPKGNLFIAFNINLNAFLFYNAETRATLGQIDASQNHCTIIKRIQDVLTASGITSKSCLETITFRFPDRFDKEGIAIPIPPEIKSMWMQLKQGAHKILSDTIETLNIDSEIRIWPTNFDTGIFFDDGKSVNQWAGFASADTEVIAVPYFYNSMAHKGKKVKPTDLPPLKAGYWSHTHWNGAVLPMNGFSTVEHFLTQAKSFLLESNKGLHKKAKS